eukprot:Pgem_evm1s8005
MMYKSITATLSIVMHICCNISLIQPITANSFRQGHSKHNINQYYSRYNTVVYAMTNNLANEVTAFSDNGYGKLSKIGTYQTGGKGYPFKLDDRTADVNALFSQDSLVVHKNQVWAVNAGSNSVTKFEIDDKDLTLKNRKVLVIPSSVNASSTPCLLVNSEKLNVVCAVTCVGVGSIVCYDDETNEVNENLLVTDMGIMDAFTSLNVFENQFGINEFASIHDADFSPNNEVLVLVSFQGMFIYRISAEGKFVDPSIITAEATTAGTTQNAFYQNIFVGPRNLSNVNLLPLQYNRRPFSVNVISTRNEENDAKGIYTVIISDPLGSRAADFQFNDPTTLNPAEVILPGGTLSVHMLNLNNDNNDNGIQFTYLNPGLGVGQLGACWSLYRNGIVYISNTVSGTLSSMSLELETGLMQVQEAANTVGVPKETQPFFGVEFPDLPIYSAPLDMNIRADGAILYVIEGVAGSVSSYFIDGTGVMVLRDVTEPITNFKEQRDLAESMFPKLVTEHQNQGLPFTAQHAVHGIASYTRS